MPTSFAIETLTPHASESLFDVSLDIDAHVVSMGNSREEATAGVTSGRIGLHETVTWKARHFGIWFTMTTEIVELARPHRFVDQQRSGPFAVFRHEHVFETHTDHTRMVDTVTVGSPVFGRVAERLVLVPYLRRLVERRNEHLLGLLGER